MPIPRNFTAQQAADVSTIAEAQVAAAATYLARLTDAVTGILPGPIDPQFPVPPEAPVLETLTPPSLLEIVPGALPIPRDVRGSLELPTFPVFAVDVPALQIGAAPTPNFGEAPASPGIAVPALPEAPTITLPAAPTLLSLNVVGFNGITIPAFDGGDLPVLNIVEPSVATYVPGSQYTSALLDALKTELTRRVTTGGSGLNPDVEQAIYDRAREREIKTVEEAILGLERMEAMGFAMPPGVYLDGRIKIETEYGKVQAGLSRDIMIKQAELELANVQEALKTATQLEAQLLDYSNKVEQRLFETAKYTTEAGIQVYNAKVEAYKSLLDAYRTKVTIYEAVIRGEIAKVEAYRAQIAAEQAKAEINNALVQQYKVAADVALTNVEIYKARVQAVQVAAQIEQTKVAMYGEQVRAYATKANAFTAEVEGFKALMQAEATKQEAYRSQVQAFESQVNAVAKQADALIEEYKGRIAVYTAEWDGYRSAAQAEAARVQAASTVNTSRAEVYKAQSQVAASYNETLTKQWQVALEQSQRAAEIAIAASKATGDLTMTARGLILDGTKVTAQVAAQLGAAALNAFNFSNSLSFAESESSSFSSSISTSTSTSTNTNYNL